MLDYRQVLANPDKVRELLLRRKYELPLEKISQINTKRLELIKEVDGGRQQLKQGSKEIAHQAKTQDVSQAKQKMSELGERLSKMESELSAVENQLETLMMEIPNTPAEHTPQGKGEEDNPVVRVWGEKKSFTFEPKTHDELGEKNGLLDFKRAAKLSGTRFSVLKGAMCRLERAIMSYLLDMGTLEHGYTQVSVPYMVNRKTMTGTGQLPKFEADMFRVTAGDREWFLIPTAEVPVTNLHADEILSERDLPLTYCCLTPCFRAEAGSAGKDIKGLIRQHQFEKVELVRFSKPENSFEQLEILTNHAEKLLQKLNLHYRVVALCTADIGFSSQFTYDLEVWLPGQNAYREISSCSNFGDFQARRAKIRYKNEATGKNEFVHTLNGSGLPIGRTLVAVLEQYQQKDGSILIPEALQKYTNFKRILSNGSIE